MLSDLDFVQSVEADSHNLPFITPWERTQHEGAVRFPDFRHFIVEAGAGYDRAGFVILQGCRNQHRSVELKRIVLQPKGQGHRPGLRAAAEAHGLSRPARAPLLARREGASTCARRRCTRARASSRKGVLRESVKLADGYDSLVVMSMLDREYDARVALELE